MTSGNNPMVNTAHYYKNTSSASRGATTTKVMYATLPPVDFEKEVKINKEL
jgi:hypothetical protein